MKNIPQAYRPSYLWFWPPLILGGSVISTGTIHDLRRLKVPGAGPLWNPWTLAGLKPRPGFPTSYVVVSFVFNGFRVWIWEVIVRFVDMIFIRGIDCLNFLFIRLRDTHVFFSSVFHLSNYLYNLQSTVRPVLCDLPREQSNMVT
jgi:hypothetical protein